MALLFWMGGNSFVMKSGKVSLSYCACLASLDTVDPPLTYKSTARNSERQ